MRKTTQRMLALGLSLGLTATLAAQSVHAEGDLYTDIAASYAQEAILSLHAKGIVNSKGNGLFGPRDFDPRAVCQAARADEELTAGYFGGYRFCG